MKKIEDINEKLDNSTNIQKRPYHCEDLKGRNVKLSLAKRKYKLQKKIILRELRRGGRVKQICDNLNINVSNFYTWYARDKKFQRNVDDAKRITCKQIEETMFEVAVEQKNVTMLIFLACNLIPELYRNIQRTEVIESPEILAQRKAITGILSKITERKKLLEKEDIKGIEE